MGEGAWAGKATPPRRRPAGLCSRCGRSPQILTCLLTEQRIVFFSSSWALLALVAECFLAYLHPLQWQHTFVPILSGQMLDFVMAPTSFLMGCHLDHFQEVSKVRPPPSAGRPCGDTQAALGAPPGRAGHTGPGGGGWPSPPSPGCALGATRTACCRSRASGCVRGRGILGAGTSCPS